MSLKSIPQSRGGTYILLALVAVIFGCDVFVAEEALRKCEQSSERTCDAGRIYLEDTCGERGLEIEQCDCGCSLDAKSCKSPCCSPNCAGKECGPDGCGGICGSCTTGMTCNTTGQCTAGTVILNSAKDITSFTILGIAGTIGTNTISLTVPYGTSLTGLIPTIIHTGAGVSPASGVANNFTSPVIYTVTAADASTKTYTVSVTVASCVAYCPGKQCGDDGCGGSCGVCGTNQQCNASGQCMCIGNWDPVYYCTACKTHWIDNSNDCATCPDNWDPVQNCNVCKTHWTDNGNKRLLMLIL